MQTRQKRYLPISAFKTTCSQNVERWFRSSGTFSTEKIIPSNTLMRFRKLRIAFSATCLIACVLLIVLWVRSYCG